MKHFKSTRCECPHNTELERKYGGYHDCPNEGVGHFYALILFLMAFYSGAIILGLVNNPYLVINKLWFLIPLTFFIAAIFCKKLSGPSNM